MGTEAATSDPWEYVPAALRTRYDELCVSIPNAVRLSARKFGEREALVDGDLRLTFGELEEAMLDTVRAMIALGVRPGDRVALWAPNCGPWVLAALGIQGAGGILVPVNTRFKGEEAAYILGKSGATALVVANGFLGTDYVDMLRRADPGAAVLRPGRVIVAAGEARDGEVAWNDFIAAGQGVSRDDAMASIDALTPDTLSDIMFTSGTTGHPKGVMLTHGQSLRAHGWLAEVMDYRAGDRYLIIPPFFHTFGYKSGWMACIIHGVTILPEPVFTVEKVLRTIEEQRISILLGPPTLFQGILDSPERGSFDLSSLRVTMASAATVPPELVRRMREELGAEITHSAYGMTEGTSLTTTTFPYLDDFDDITTTVGRAAWGTELRVVDDNEHDVSPGTPGELLVRGYNVMQGYWEEPEKTAQAITEDGWLRTGDICVMDERGYVRITDRKKDVIFVGGFNVYPAEVERILGTHPDIDSIAVVGTTDDRLGEVPVAFVVPRTGSSITEEAFLSWARDRIANFKVPRRAILLAELPRNASAKVLKNDLRRRLSQTP